MSADIHVACGHCGSAIADENITYNLSPMLREAGMPDWRDMKTMDTVKAGAIWRRVHIALLDDPEHFRRLNPENGWGNYDDAVKVISRLADACQLAEGNGRIEMSL